MKNLFLLIFLISCSHHVSRSKTYMVSSQGEASSKIAKAIFDRGGNAIDAAIALSFAISVERPQSTGIGGGGFMLIHFPDQSMVAVDFREVAPILANAKTYEKESSVKGIKAAGVPGLVAGLYEIHNKYGKLPWSELLEGAIGLARNGFLIYPHLANAIKVSQNDLKDFSESRKLFFDEKGNPKAVGELLIQKDLANTLELIAKSGKDSFYKGDIAKKILNYSHEKRGLLSERDFTEYNPKFRHPLIQEIHNYKIVSMPPPSSGGAHVIQILNILENLPLDLNNGLSSKNYHLFAQSEYYAFYDRYRYLGDNDFKDVPLDGIIKKSYAKVISDKILTNNGIAELPSKEKDLNPWNYESSDTTHFSIMSNDGYAIASTQTINGYFGSYEIVPGTGIILNNEMDDFTTKIETPNLFGAVGGPNNLVEPKKRPLSSMSPTFVLKEGKPIVTLGSPSGPRIISCVAQTLMNYLYLNMPIEKAVNSLRIHHQWKPNTLFIEKNAPDELIDDLKRFGYKVELKDLGCSIQAIEYSVKEQEFTGVSDGRNEGMSIGG